MSFRLEIVINGPLELSFNLEYLSNSKLNLVFSLRNKTFLRVHVAALMQSKWIWKLDEKAWVLLTWNLKWVYFVTGICFCVLFNLHITCVSIIIVTIDRQYCSASWHLIENSETTIVSILTVSVYTPVSGYTPVRKLYFQRIFVHESQFDGLILWFKPVGLLSGVLTDKHTGR